MVKSSGLNTDRTMMYTNFNVKFIPVWTIHSNSALCIVINCLNNGSNPSGTPIICMVHHSTLRGTLSKVLWRWTKTRWSIWFFFFFLYINLTWSWSTIEMTSAFPCLGMKLICMSSIFVQWLMIFFNDSFSTTFSVWFVSFNPQTFTISKALPAFTCEPTSSLEILPSFMIALMRSANFTAMFWWRSLQRYLMDIVIFLISFSVSMKGPYQLLKMVVNQLWVLLKTAVFHPKELLHYIDVYNTASMQPSFLYQR